MQFKSGVSSLKRFAADLRDMPRQVHRDAARELPAELDKVMQVQFARGSGPGGAYWAVPKAGGRKMYKSGALERGFRFYAVPRSTGISIRITNTQEYFEYIQKGTDKMRARPMVPDDANFRGAWQKAARVCYVRACEAWAKRTKNRSR